MEQSQELLELKADLLKSGDHFDAAEFIAGCRQSQPLDEIQQYLSRNYTLITDELIEVINKDYGDFVNLSSGLVGVDTAIELVRQPALQLRTDTAVARDAIGAHVTEVTLHFSAA